MIEDNVDLRAPRLHQFLAHVVAIIFKLFSTDEEDAESGEIA